MAAKRIAMINMKGGVGKSTLTVNLAWQLSGVIGRDNNVLVVDLDPQFNASQYLLGTARYKYYVMDTDRPTVWDVFEEQTRTPGHARPSPLQPIDAIVNIATWPMNKLDLLPSRLELAWSLKQPSRKEMLLKRFLDRVDNQYHLILIDCAPTDSVLTTAAYNAAPHIIVPVKPEFLSTIGLPLLSRSIADHNAQPENSQTSVVGIVFNHASNYLPEEALSKAEVKSVAADYGWYMFSSEIAYSRSFPKGAREGKPLMKTPKAHKKQKAKMAAFANEFARVVGL